MRDPDPTGRITGLSRRRGTRVRIQLTAAQVRRAGWEERARRATPRDREMLLTRADELRGAGDEGSTLAFACYRAYRDHLDLQQDEGRIRWLLANSRLDHADLRPLAERAAHAEPGTDLWIEANYRVAVYDLDRRGFPEAERRLRRIFARVHGRRDRDEYRTCLSLSLVAAGLGNDVESLYLAHRGHEICEECGDATGRAMAALRVVCALVLFRDWDRFGPALSRAELRISSLPPASRKVLARALRPQILDAHVERGRFDEALDLGRAIEESRDDLPGWWGTSLRAYLRSRQGRIGEARPHIARLAEMTDAPTWPRLIGVLSDLHCAVAERALERIHACSSDLSELLALRGDRDVGTGHRVRFALEAVQILDGALESPEPIERLRDLAALAIMDRIHEIAAFGRDFSTALRLSAELREILGDATQRLRGRDAGVDERVDTFLKDEIEPAPMGIAAYGPEGVFRVCAWCGRLETVSDRWLPVGHLLPVSRRDRISHGMCRDCSESARV